MTFTSSWLWPTQILLLGNWFLLILLASCKLNSHQGLAWHLTGATMVTTVNLVGCLGKTVTLGLALGGAAGSWTLRAHAIPLRVQVLPQEFSHGHSEERDARQGGPASQSQAPAPAPARLVGGRLRVSGAISTSPPPAGAGSRGGAWTRNAGSWLLWQRVNTRRLLGSASGGGGGRGAEMVRAPWWRRPRVARHVCGIGLDF